MSWLVSHENGKTYPESVASVAKGVECVEMGTALPNMIAGSQLDVSRGVNCEVTKIISRQPSGFDSPAARGNLSGFDMRLDDWNSAPGALENAARNPQAEAMRRIKRDV